MGNVNHEKNTPTVYVNLEVEMFGDPIMVWEDRECFNGKRPFGNSGWEEDLYTLVKAGYVEEVDTKSANKMICSVIDYL